MCDFKVRQNTNVHRYTVQCVLPINIFNEKIFTIVWFWLLIDGFVTVVGLLNWLFQVIHWPSQYRYVRHRLSGAVALKSAANVAAAALGLSPTDVGSKADVQRFADVYLRRDGLFVLRLVAKNAGDLVSTELVAELWNAYSLSHRYVLPSGVGNVRSFRSLLRASRRATVAGTNDAHVGDNTRPQGFEEV